MAEKKILVGVYVDEESILGKIAEMDDLVHRMRRVMSDLNFMMSHKKMADSEAEPAAESN